MANLETVFFGVHFPNPFVIGSGPATTSASKVKRAFAAGWGGVVLKTISLYPPRNVSPRIYVLKSGKQKRGILDIELLSEESLEYWEEQIDLIRQDFPSRPIIASINGGGDPHEWQEVVRRLEPHGVNAFELNVSCPSFGKGRGEALGQDPVALAAAVRWVREATDFPVLVKLTPNVTDIVALARVAMEAGATSFTLANSLTGIGGIDLETFSPLPSVNGKGMIGGYGGPGIKPVSLKITSQIARALRLPVAGVGGVSTWQDAAEYITLGASVVQVCTAVLWNGFGIINQMKNGLSRYLDGKGFQSVEELVGKALPNLGEFSDLDLSYRAVSHVDAELCNGCEVCVRSCFDGGYEAIRMEGKLAVIDEEKCDGCGLCAGVCAEGAIDMVERRM